MLSLLALAQEQGEQEIPPTRISFLLIGDPTLDRNDETEDSSGEQTRDERNLNSIDALRAKGKLPGAEEDMAKRARGAGLKNLNDLIDFRLAANTPVELTVEAGKSGKWKEWTKINLPPGPPGRDLTLLFFQKNPQHNWTKDIPNRLVLDNSLQAVPEGAVRVVNVSSRPVFCKINDKEVKLNPGANGVLAAVDPQAQRLKCEFMFENPKTGELKVFFRRNFNRKEGKRKQIVFYNMDPNQSKLFSPINLMLTNFLPLDRPTISEEFKKRKDRPKPTVPPPPGGWKTESSEESTRQESSRTN